MAPTSVKYKITKESIKTQKVTNKPNLISQLEPSEKKIIMGKAKMWTYVSILSGGTGASVTTEKRIPRKKKNIKSPAMSPPGNYPIKNQDIDRLITERHPSVTPIKEKYPPEFKPLSNDAHNLNSTEDGPNNYRDNSLNDKEDSVNKLKVTNN